ncbi:MAG: hypothetical protein IJA90_08175 [Peptococcaceae bacterium]|nr:hypothetical protein [Peptococcaceae bacterium]
MYDWNGNGKHDSFDDAMFMALLEDDLERHPPKTGKKTSTAKKVADMSLGDVLVTGVIGGLIAILFMSIAYGYALVGIGIIIIAVVAVFLIVGEPVSNTSSSSTSSQRQYPQTNNERVRERMKTIQQETSYGKIIKTYDKTLVFQLTERWKKLGEACLYYCNYEKEYYIQKVDFAKIGACEVYWAGRIKKSFAKTDFKIPYVEKVPNNGLVIYPDDMREPLVMEMYDTEEVYKIVLFIIQHPELWRKDTAWETILELEVFGNTKSDFKTDVKAAPKPEAKPESKQVSTPARSTHSSSYTSGYIPVYTPSYTSSSILDDEPDETVRERLDYDLSGTGYDSYDLEWMDEEERNQVLEDNFLDPYDYDFDDLD